MIANQIFKALDSLSAWLVRMGAKWAPLRELDVFPTRRMYGKRAPIHIAAFIAKPGWVFLELGSWTVEVAWNTLEDLAAKAEAEAAPDSVMAGL